MTLGLTVTDLASDRQFEVHAYIGNITALGLRPYTCYKHHVLAGARMMIVDENVSVTTTEILAMCLRPTASPMKYPMIEVKAT